MIHPVTVHFHVTGVVSHTMPVFTGMIERFRFAHPVRVAIVALEENRMLAREPRMCSLGEVTFRCPGVRGARVVCHDSLSFC